MAHGSLGADVIAAARPLSNTAALAVRGGPAGASSVVVADLHLGLGASPDAPLGPPGASAPELARSLLEACGRARVHRLIIAGDVKHPIVGVPAWLRPVVFDFFATLLEAGVQPEIVLGNHDVGLVRHLPREVVVHPATGWAGNGVGIFHGHRWPSSALLEQRTLVAGHLHPGYRFAPTVDSPLGKRGCWIRVEFAGTSGVLHPDGRPARARELVILPAFHPLAGVESLNRERPERGRSFLYQRFLRRGRARAYLMDGTDLGQLTNPSPAVRAR